MNGAIRTPCCPLCGKPPMLVLAGGAQAFCGTEGCRIIIWDATASMDENMNDIGFLDLSALDDGSRQ
jgi:hypothetical protein